MENPAPQTPPALGERAARGGFHAQDCFAANIILRSLRHRTLEWIRLADITAGRVDDFLLGSPGRVDAYQVKWARDGRHFTFRELIRDNHGKPSLISQLSDGWVRLRQSHPERRIVVHLQTNETPSPSNLIDVGVIGTCSLAKGSFSQLFNEVWRPFRSTGTPVPDSWQMAWEELRKETGLPAEEFSQFVRDCELEFGLSVPGKDNAQGDGNSTYIRDLDQLTGKLQAIVADPTQPRDQPIEISCSELLQLLDWQRRLEFLNRHEFPEPTAYREIKETADKLRVAVEHLQGGYLVLLGDPGSGKSTLLTKTLVALPCRLIRYYAFVPDAPAPQSTRGEASNFLHDVTTALGPVDIHNRDTVV